MYFYESKTILIYCLFSDADVSIQGRSNWTKLKQCLAPHFLLISDADKNHIHFLGPDVGNSLISDYLKLFAGQMRVLHIRKIN